MNCPSRTSEIPDGSRFYSLDCWVDPQPSWEYFKIVNIGAGGRQEVMVDSVRLWTTCGASQVEKASWGSIKAMFRQ